MSINARQIVTHYEKATGRLTGFMTIQPDNFDENEHLDGSHNPKTHYYDGADQQVKPRVDAGVTTSALTVTQGDPITISNLPVPSNVLVVNTGYVTVDDGVLTLNTDAALGDVRVIFNEVTYLPQEFIFEVTA